MEIEKILSMCDHTLLAQTATWDDIKQICKEGIEYKTASVCIPPCYCKQAKEFINDNNSNLQICTVIGFPNGNSSTNTKVYETKQALLDGADEIDMVINIGQLKAGNFEYIENEISSIKQACGLNILKVIIETCLLTDYEKIKMCKIVTKCGADFIKTSTGFSTSGATFEDVNLFKNHIGNEVKIKAAGGISSLDDAEKFISLGASRLGTSRIVKLAKQKKYPTE